MDIYLFIISILNSVLKLHIFVSVTLLSMLHLLCMN